MHQTSAEELKEQTWRAIHKELCKQLNSVPANKWYGSESILENETQ